MRIADLAALVSVRNHINIVMNDKSVTDKNDFRSLNQARIKLDKMFVEALRGLDFDNLFTPELKIVSLEQPIPIERPKDMVHTSGYLQVQDVLPLTSAPLVTVTAPKATGFVKFGDDEIDLKSSPSGIWDEDPPEVPNREDEPGTTETAPAWEDEDKSSYDMATLDADFRQRLYVDKPQAEETAPDAAEARDLAIIEERIRAQKEQLKKEGRSNKRISKKQDDSPKKE